MAAAGGGAAGEAPRAAQAVPQPEPGAVVRGGAAAPAEGPSPASLRVALSGVLPAALREALAGDTSGQSQDRRGPLRSALEDALRSLLPRALQEAHAANSVAAQEASHPSSASGALRCPVRLEPLLTELGRQVRASDSVAARTLFGSLRVADPKGEDYAALRVLLAVFFPQRSVEGVKFEATETGKGRKAVDAWAEAGHGQLPSLGLTLGLERVRLLNLVAMRVRRDPAFHRRKAASLLLDAASLKDYRS